MDGVPVLLRPFGAAWPAGLCGLAGQPVHGRAAGWHVSSGTVAKSTAQWLEIAELRMGARRIGSCTNLSIPPLPIHGQYPLDFRVARVVDLFAGGVGIEPGQGAPHAFPKGDGSLEAGDEGLDFAVVEDHAPALVAQETAFQLGHDLGQEIGGDVDDVGLHAQRVGDGGVDLVPGQHFVGRDVEGVADGRRVAQQTHESAAEVFRVGDNPERTAVTVDDNGLALEQPVGQGIAARRQRHREVVVIGVGRAHDGGGKALLPVRLDEQFLARDLVARVGPVGVVERRRLGDDVVGGRRLVRGRGADEDVLLDLAREERYVARDVVRAERESSRPPRQTPGRPARPGLDPGCGCRR